MIKQNIYKKDDLREYYNTRIKEEGSIHFDELTSKQKKRLEGSLGYAGYMLNKAANQFKKDFGKYAQPLVVGAQNDKLLQFTGEYEIPKKIFWFGFDKQFFAMTPAINLNFHNGFRIEFEWLFFQFYITFK